MPPRVVTNASFPVRNRAHRAWLAIHSSQFGPRSGLPLVGLGLAVLLDLAAALPFLDSFLSLPAQAPTAFPLAFASAESSLSGPHPATKATRPKTKNNPEIGTNRGSRISLLPRMDRRSALRRERSDFGML